MGRACTHIHFNYSWLHGYSLPDVMVKYPQSEHNGWCRDYIGHKSWVEYNFKVHIQLLAMSYEKCIFFVHDRTVFHIYNKLA